MLRRHFRKDMCCDNLDIFYTFAQGRNTHGGIKHQLVQFAGEETFISQTFQIRIAGCNYTHVKLLHDTGFFVHDTIKQCVRQFIANFYRQLFYFVKEESTTQGKFQFAGNGLVAIHTSKEFSFQFFERCVHALNNNKRRSSTGAGLVNTMCQTLLAGTGFALQ